MTKILTMLMLLIPFWAWAAPTQVTLFPASAQVEETSPVAMESSEAGLWSCTLTLPGQADPASLRFNRLADKGTIADLSWKTRQESDQAALGPLNARLAELQGEQDKELAKLEGVRGRMAFWKAQTQPSQQTVAALRELAAELGETLRADTEKAKALEQRLKKLDTEIAEVEQEIAAVAGQVRTVWEVRVLVAGAAPKELSYAYTLADCGWSPVYRLEAMPGQKSIDFAWQAKVWQRSGQDWGGVRLFLATMQPEIQAEPSDLPPWEISPMRIFQKTMAAPAMMDMRAGASEEMLAAAPAPPMEIRHSTYAAWDMGKRSIPAGDTRIFEIEHGAWPASFVHLLRPSLDAKAFVQAKTEFTEPKELPPGTAFFFIDGAMVDQRQFSLSGREATLSFGTDPLLTCTTVLKDKKTGEKGLFNQKQTFLREWTLTVHNAASHPVLVRIEEPRPLPRDERITLEFTASPEPLKEDNPEILAWNSTIAAGGESVISLSLKIDAPDDLNIDPGWRW